MNKYIFSCYWRTRQALVSMALAPNAQDFNRCATTNENGFLSEKTSANKYSSVLNMFAFWLEALMNWLFAEGNNNSNGIANRKP